MLWRSILAASLSFASLSLPPARAAPLSEQYDIERIVPGSAFHGVHGLAFDGDDNLYAGSVVGQSVYRVDTRSGQVDIVVGPPEGMADDLVFLADGTLVWTSISQGLVRARSGNGPLRVIARDLPGVNSINVRRRDGRLFVAQVFGGDGVWELDPQGVKPPRSILKDPGGFNGFDIGPDGMLYGPLWFKKQVVRINPDTGELKIIAADFGTPAAANFDSKANLYVLDTARGEVVRVDIATGAKRVVAQLATALDNLAIDSRDRIFVSNMADNGIQEVDPRTGAARQVVKGALAFPQSIAAAGTGPKDTLYIADMFAFRRVDGASGAVSDIARSHAAGTPIQYANAVTANERHVILTNSGGLVQRYDRQTLQLLTSWKELRGAQNALELADGSLLVSVTARGVLMRVHGTDGAQREDMISGLEGPAALALGSGPNEVYVSEVRAGRIARVDLAAKTTRVVATGLNRPQALALMLDGALVVLEIGRQQLTRVDPATGATSVIARELPVGRPGIATPAAGLAAGADGTLYFSSDIENAIYRVRPRRRPSLR